MNQKLADENLIYPDAQRPKKLQGTIVVISILLLIIALGAISYGWFLYSQKNENLEEELKFAERVAELKEASNKMVSLYKNESAPALQGDQDSQNYGLENEVPKIPLTGRFLFSGKMLGSNTGMQIFTLDVSSSTSKSEVYLTDVTFSVMPEFLDKKSPDQFFFLGTSDIEEDKLSVQSYNNVTKELKAYNSTNGQNERSFEWSETASLFALNRQSVEAQNYVDMLSIENWEIAIINPDTDVTVDVIQGGFQPQWSPDGSKLLFLKKDGLYLYSLQTKEQTKVVASGEGEIITTSMIDLSSQGTHLAWTTAKSGLITMNKITSWEPFEINELGRIQEPNTEFYWPQFSPDGMHYAVQAIDTLKEGDYVRKNARIEVRGTEGRTIQYLYSLDNFAFNVLFTDDWIN